MGIISEVMQYTINAIECFIWWRLMKNVMDLKVDIKYHTGAAAIMFLLMFLKKIILELPDMIQYQAIGTICLMVYSLSAILLCFKNSLIEKLIWCVVFYFGLIIMELATVLVLNLVLDKSVANMSTADQMSIWVIFCGKLMTILFFEMIIRKRKSKLVIEFIYFQELSIIITLNVILLLLAIFVFSNQHNIISHIDNIIVFFFGVVLLITIYTVVLIFRIDKKSKEELETKLKLQQIELELKLNDDMISIADKLRKLRHDMNNHIGLIKSLAQSEKYDDLKEYINQIYEDVEMANQLVITENKTLSVLINAKKSLAKEKNIDFQSVVAMQELNMQNKDICTLLGNILDNAIEAAEKAKSNKYIDLSIQKTEEGCIINCENSLGKKPVVSKGKFVTLKDNTYIHGIGTENIRDIVAKYKGEVNFDYDDEMFNIRVVMPV
jgi:hypothetical protein